MNRFNVYLTSRFDIGILVYVASSAEEAKAFAIKHVWDYSQMASECQLHKSWNLAYSETPSCTY